jgi:hypothetical protein
MSVSEDLQLDGDDLDQVFQNTNKMTVVWYRTDDSLRLLRQRQLVVKGEYVQDTVRKQAN